MTQAKAADKRKAAAPQAGFAVLSEMPHSHAAHGHHYHGETAEHHHHHEETAEPHHHKHHAPDVKSGERVLTVRAISGLSGDMMLSGLAALTELSNNDLNSLVKELKLPALEGCLTVQPRAVNHIGGVGCDIKLPHEHSHRTLADIRKIITDSAMPGEVKDLSVQAFTLLAQAEAAVHDKKLDDVSFHEVGALDSILDTCLTCRLFKLLDPVVFVCSPLPLADGVIRCAHGYIPSPAPAVLQLLTDVPVYGFSGKGETVTPTALSLLKALGATFDRWPAMTVNKTVISYGGKVFANAPNGAVWALGVS